MSEHDFGVTRACGLVQISRSLFRYCRRRVDREGLHERIEEIAALKRRYGYRRVYLRLRREGWTVNRKRVYRIYREAGLAVRRRKRKRIGAVERKPLPKPVAANLSWSMDFVSDGLADGRRLRCLTVVDDCTRECLAIEVDTSITGTRVKHVMNRLAEARGLPKSITVDNGPVPRASTRRLGLPSQRQSLVHPSRKAERECLHRILQRQVPRRMLERALVHHDGASSKGHRVVADRIQHRATTQLDRKHHTGRVCRETGGTNQQANIIINCGL
jgi:putative transposase